MLVPPPHTQILLASFLSGEINHKRENCTNCTPHAWPHCGRHPGFSRGWGWDLEGINFPGYMGWEVGTRGKFWRDDPKSSQCRKTYEWSRSKLEPCTEQMTGSGLRKENNKAVNCHPVYLTYMQSTSCEMLGWMSYKLELRLSGEI